MAAIPVPASTQPTVAIGVGATEQAEPDIAYINAGLNITEPKADTAMEKNNREFAKIMAVVKKYGIDPKDLKTNGVTVREDFDYTDDGPKSRGFLAGNSLMITVRNLDSVGDLMSELIAAGANNVNGPSFGLENNDTLTNTAREAAFDKGQQRALAYARKAGFKSVRLLSVNEGANDTGYAYAMAADAAADAGAMKAGDFLATPIEPGLVSETVYATFIFEMVP